MGYTVGEVVEGTVAKITHFGVFLDLHEGKHGLVHISEVADTYVKDIRGFLKVGEKVKARVLTINPDGKMDLSIKKAFSEQDSSLKLKKDKDKKPSTPDRTPSSGSSPFVSLFEGKLAKFLKGSEERL